MLTGCPLHASVDCDLQDVVGYSGEPGLVLEAMLEVSSTLGVEPAECVDDGGGDKVVPGGHAEIAMEEKEDHENHRHEEMGSFEKFIIPVSMKTFFISKSEENTKFEEFVGWHIPNPRDRHECEPRLGNEGYHTRHPNTTSLPCHDKVALLDVDNDEWESVNQGQDKHGPSNPVMPDVELLV